jgi:hypothetical protein
MVGLNKGLLDFFVVLAPHVSAHWDINCVAECFPKVEVYLPCEETPKQSNKPSHMGL